MISYLNNQCLLASKESGRCQRNFIKVAESSYKGRGSLARINVSGESHDPRVTLQFSPLPRKKADLKLVG